MITTYTPPSAVVRDPHHEGRAEWGWDGERLWHRHQGEESWTLVRRVSFTPIRFSLIASLIEEEQCNTH